MNENERKLKHCVYCGAKTEGQAYCPICGKLIITIKGEQKVDERKIAVDAISKPLPYERTCSGCSSVITSTILEQCPICNTFLEPVPQYRKPSTSKPGFIFTNKKLKSEKELVLRKDSWHIKEGVNVFITSLLVYFFAQFFIIFLILSQVGFDQSTEITIEIIILAQIPGILLGIYPLCYIYVRKHKSEKLGFKSGSKEITLAILIGFVGCLLLLCVNYLSGLINSYLYSLGFEFLDISEYLDKERNTIRGASLIWLIVLLIVVSLQAIASEVLFRGVLHNTLKEKFAKKDDMAGKLKVILLVALIYSSLYVLFSFFIGITFFLLNFMVFCVLGILYEINQNIHNTIIASIFYFNLIIILMYLALI